MDRHPSRIPTHPGTLLAEDILPALGVSRNTLQAILRGERSVTADMAVRLGKVVGNGPRLWINLQSAYDLHRAQQSVNVYALDTLEPV